MIFIVLRLYYGTRTEAKKRGVYKGRLTTYSEKHKELRRTLDGPEYPEQIYILFERKYDNTFNK